MGDLAAVFVGSDVLEQAPAQDGGGVRGFSRGEIPRGACGDRVQVVHCVVHELGFVPVGVVSLFRCGDDHDGVGRVGHRFGGGGEGVPEAVGCPLAPFSLQLVSSGYPADQFVKQDQRGAVPDETLYVGAAGVAEQIIVPLYSVEGSVAAQRW